MHRALSLLLLVFSLLLTSGAAPRAQTLEAEGARLLALGEAEAATEVLSEAAESDQLSPRGYRLLGQAYSQTLREQRAVASYQRADTSRVEVLVLLARSLTTLGRTQDATTAYERALAIDSLHVPAADGLAQLLRPARPREAVHLYDRLVRANTLNPVLRVRLADALWAARDTAGTLRQLTRAYALDRDAEQTAVRLAEVQLEADSIRDARRTLARAITRYPESLALWRIRGRLELSRNNVAPAIHAYEHAVALSDSAAIDLRDLGIAHYWSTDIADIEAALQYLTMSLAQMPKDAYALQYAGLAQRTLGNFTAADSLLSASAERLGRGRIASVYEALGEVKARRGNFEDAVRMLRAARVLSPQSPSVLLNLAGALEGLDGGDEEALAAYRLYLEKFPAAGPNVRGLVNDRIWRVEDRLGLHDDSGVDG